MKKAKLVKVILFTEKAKIEGYLDIREGFLITNYLNEHTLDFLTLKDVCVVSWDGGIIMNCDFLCVNKRAVIFAKTEGDK